MSFSLHSSTVNLGGGRRSSSSGSNSSSSCSVSVKSLIGLMSRNVSARPSFEEPVERLALDRDQIRQLEDLVEVGERIAVPDSRARGQGLLLAWWTGQSSRLTSEPGRARRRADVARQTGAARQPGRLRGVHGDANDRSSEESARSTGRHLTLGGTATGFRAGYEREPTRSRFVVRHRHGLGPAGCGPEPEPSHDRRTGELLDLDLAPAASRLGLGLLGVFLVTFSSTAFGAPSTRSLASLRPRLVSPRTSLMTWIFLSPAAVRMTSNSSFSSASAAPPPPPPAAAAATRHGGGRGDAELLFEVLQQLGELEHGHAGDGVEQSLRVGHGQFSSGSASVACGCGFGRQSPRPVGLGGLLGRCLGGFARPGLGRCPRRRRRPLSSAGASASSDCRLGAALARRRRPPARRRRRPCVDQGLEPVGEVAGHALKQPGELPRAALQGRRRAGRAARRGGQRRRGPRRRLASSTPSPSRPPLTTSAGWSWRSRAAPWPRRRASPSVERRRWPSGRSSSVVESSRPRSRAAKRTRVFL